MAEGARLAGELGVAPRFVTWPARPAADLEPLAAALAELAGRTRPAALLLADTDVGRQLAPMVAHRLGSGAVVACSDVLVREEALVFVKPAYGGWLEREIDPEAGIVPVATLDLAGMGELESSPDGLPAPEVVDVETLAPSRVIRLDLVPPDPRSVDLVHAKRIVAAGSGSASEDLLAAVRELADLLEGSVGATRPVVDDGRLPKERLIGQTGRTVTPELYLALGISGSPHHVAGVRRADRILSINRDVRAPIFQFSDVGYVADLVVVLPALVQKIKEWRDAPGSPSDPR
jgi:electron transfer flavoprotein alpha subunit